MELQIKDLVDSIKKEGIDVAKKEAEKIVNEAKKKADELISKANSQADKTLQDAKKEIEILKESARVSAQQAQRDAVLSFKKEIEKEYQKILACDIKKNLSDKALADLIAAAVADKDVSKLTAQVAEVSEILKSQLADEIKNGLEIKPVKGIDAGFKLSSKDGSGYIDCTEEAIASMLAPFFSDLKF